MPGEHRGLGVGVGLELEQLRPYEVGDDVRQLDPAASARTGEPYVRWQVPDRALTSWIVLDLSPSMAFGTTDRLKCDVAEGAARVIGRLALRAAGRVGLLTFGGLAPRVLPPTGNALAPPDPHSLTLAAAEEKVGWVQAAAGDRFDRLELNTYPSGGPIVVTDRVRAAAQERVDDLRRRSGGIDLTVEELLDSPHVFIGSLASLTEKFQMLRERLGVSSFMATDIDVLAPVVERLAGT
jgi:hypothetical protein